MTYRTLEPPRELATWLDADARRLFDRLPYSQKRRYVDLIEKAQTVETRERRIAKAVGMLRGERGR
jgi:uncharacterized protein YdeI (YjbR/CyaY-like superfamily)